MEVAWPAPTELIVEAPMPSHLALLRARIEARVMHLREYRLVPGPLLSKLIEVLEYEMVWLDERLLSEAETDRVLAEAGVEETAPSVSRGWANVGARFNVDPDLRAGGTASPASVRAKILELIATSTADQLGHLDLDADCAHAGMLRVPRCEAPTTEPFVRPPRVLTSAPRGRHFRRRRQW